VDHGIGEMCERGPRSPPYRFRSIDAEAPMPTDVAFEGGR